MGYHTVHFKPLIIPLLLLFAFLGCASPKENMTIGRETRGLLKNTKNICVITAFSPSEIGQLDQLFISSQAIDILRNNGIDAIGKNLPNNKSVWVSDYTPAQTIIQGCDAVLSINCKQTGYCRNYRALDKNSAGKVYRTGKSIYHCLGAVIDIAAVVYVKGQRVVYNSLKEELRPEKFPKSIFVEEAKYPPPYKEAFQNSKFTDLIQTYANVLKLGYPPSDYSFGHYD
ncbi:MAG: hypothetical protein PVG74_06315 [Desulfobacterales bacterium]|jgi:hypothetical protein